MSKTSFRIVKFSYSLSTRFTFRAVIRLRLAANLDQALDCAGFFPLARELL